MMDQFLSWLFGLAAAISTIAMLRYRQTLD